MGNVNKPLFSNNIPLSSSRFSSSFNPAQSNLYDLGSGSLAWRNVYAQNVFATGVISGSFSGSISSAVSSSYALSSSWADRAGTAITATTATTATSASFATSAYTASFLTPGTYQVTSSWAVTASFVSTAATSISSSFATSAYTASFLTAGTYQVTASWANNAVTSSHALVAVSSSWAQRSGNSDTSTTASNANTASILRNNYTQRGFKTISLTTSSYTNALTISLAADQSTYLKVSICGISWPGTGPIGYVADFLLQKGTFNTSSTQPGVIIQEINNNSGGQTISSQIFDPGLATGSADFGLQFILSGNYDLPNAVLVFDAMGSCSIV